MGRELETCSGNKVENWLRTTRVDVRDLLRRPSPWQKAPSLVTGFRSACAGLLLALAACSTPPPAPNSPPSARPAAPATQAVPHEALNPDVRPDTVRSTICVPGYTASVRPSTSFTTGVKRKLLREAGLPPDAASTYELDHRVPLALGGHPRAQANLQLQHWDGPVGAKAKDRLERRLQTLVCAGSVPLDEARSAIYWDWPAAHRRYMPK
jgi:hypothetical protein